ncbi:unnamed protein product [Didymodactylos carnosus]|uniref:Uncharacterized protein n=1 Tax=Didymodactylos carnosus TaxID=1234261 RepID=A0A8S2CM13_9BILA|nr:unnamed protein product [Didymodactylos carnosus]CAF3523249.1 unnamed protein product [Didymodactylos carnosus]
MLQNCAPVTEEEAGNPCALLLLWSTNMSLIEVGPINGRHEIGENIWLLTQVELGKLQQGFVYECATDYCNDPSKLKLLIQSVTFKNYYESIVPLLISDQEPLPAIQLCLEYSNSTDVNFIEPYCSTSVDLDVCTHCRTAMEMNVSSTQMCMWCTKSGYDIFFEDRVVYALHNRTQLRQHFSIQCSNIKDCNSFENIKQIEKFYSMEFDFERFLGSYTTTASSTAPALFPIIYFLPLILLS